jgi:hypothetical protein
MLKVEIFIVMSVVMLAVAMLSVVILAVAMLSAVMLSVFKLTQSCQVLVVQAAPT